ncbi:MAG: hypothetical protein WCJ87_00285 [Burkholderiales bacterium]|jgi:hypothetical protein
MNHIRPVAAALALFFGAAAQASMVFDWTFTGPLGVDYRAGHGTFTARNWDDTLDGSFEAYVAQLEFDTSQPVSPELKPNYLVLTGATGWVDSVAVTGLLPKYSVDEFGGVQGFQGNDNVVLDPRVTGAAARGYFTFHGASIELANGLLYNLFVPFVAGAETVTTQSIRSDDVDPFTGEYTPINVTFTLQGQEEVGVIPIPGAMWLMLSGLGSFFLASRRRFSPGNAR